MTQPRINAAGKLPPPPAPRLVARARLKPPPDMADAPRKEWRAIVNSLPADYFRPSDVSLLAAYCVWAAYARQCRVEIDRDGITIDNGNGRRIPHPATHVLQSATAAMSQMAVKLRLCPSSRYDDRTAATKANGDANARRPWEHKG